MDDKKGTGIGPESLDNYNKRRSPENKIWVIKKV